MLFRSATRGALPLRLNEESKNQYPLRRSPMGFYNGTVPRRTLFNAYSVNVESG